MDVVGIYRRASEVLKENYIIAVPFIAANIILAVLSKVMLGGIMSRGFSLFNPVAIGALLGAAGVITFLSWILNLLAQGMARGMSNEALSRGSCSFESGMDVLSRKLGGLIVASILVGIAVMVGIVLLVIPGLIIGFLLMFTIIALVVENLGAVDAMKRSYSVVRGNLGDALVYGILLIAVLIIAGIIAAILNKIPVIGSVILTPIVRGAASGLITLAGVQFFTEAVRQTT